MTDTTAPEAAPRSMRTLTRCLLGLALLLAIAAAVLLGLGPLGWRAGWWHYRVGFTYLMPAAAYCGLAALGVAVLGLALGLRRIGPGTIAIAVIALLVGGACAYVPWHYVSQRGTFPSIHDITTDPDNPPEFRAVLPLRQADGAANSTQYAGAKVADQQRRAYPDIVPALLDVPPAEAFDRALAAARKLGWTIVAGEPAEGRIEASDRSRWFGFTDDVVIRVTPVEAGSRVDIRSESRVGGGDFRVNANRVRAFLAALHEAGAGR